MSAGNEPKPARLFLALWPDEKARSDLLKARRWVGATMAGKWVRPDNLHMTLVFLGSVDRERVPDIHRVALETAVPEFTLALDRAEFWRRNGIVCLAPSQMPEALKDLAEGLARRLGEAGFAREDRPYRAHLTLARKGRSELDALALPEPVAWEVRSFSLVESCGGPGGLAYIPLETWPPRNP